MTFNNVAQCFIMIAGILQFLGCVGGILYLYQFFKERYMTYRWNKFIEEGLLRAFAEDLEL